MDTNAILDSMYQLGVKHEHQRMQLSANAPTFDMVCNYISRLSTSQKNFDRLKLALEEVTVIDEQEEVQDLYDRQDAQNGQY